jgi:hypothetical protein
MIIEQNNVVCILEVPVYIENKLIIYSRQDRRLNVET